MASLSAGRLVNEIVASADPPATGIANPIHDGEGASAAGYAGALVAGVRTYGWAVQTIASTLGAEWLSTGWIDYRLRRPLFAGETLRISFELDPARGSAGYLTCAAIDAQTGEARVVLDGEAGLGEAPFLEALTPPAPAPAADAPAHKPGYTLDSVPLRQPLLPLGAYVTSAAARALVLDDLSLGDPGHAGADDPRVGIGRYLDARDGSSFVHPYFIAGRMAPLTRHNFTYGPTIHARSQIQHQRAPLADRQIVVGAQIVDAYERNEHWYQVLDGVVTDAAGVLALLRHTSIFRPRGT